MLHRKKMNANMKTVEMVAICLKFNITLASGLVAYSILFVYIIGFTTKHRHFYFCHMASHLKKIIKISIDSERNMRFIDLKNCGEKPKV